MVSWGRGRLWDGPGLFFFFNVRGGRRGGKNTTAEKCSHVVSWHDDTQTYLAIQRGRTHQPVSLPLEKIARQSTVHKALCFRAVQSPHWKTP